MQAQTAPNEPNRPDLYTLANEHFTRLILALTNPGYRFEQGETSAHRGYLMLLTKNWLDILYQEDGIINEEEINELSLKAASVYGDEPGDFREILTEISMTQHKYLELFGRL